MTVEHVVVLDDRYVLGELVGSGGMADVYRATDRVLHRQVAVKLLRETAEGSERDRFVDEAKTLASLSHPGLITLLDAGFRADRPYLVMEFIEGRTLSHALAQGALETDEAARIGAALARALAFAHASGVVHRDVKPGNVLLCEDGRVLLADFGIARLLGATAHHTRAGDTIGSPAYLAPEQVAGEPLTAAADVYALGLVLLEAVTGARAYDGSPIEAALARLSAGPEIPDSLGPEWRRLLAAMTRRDPAQRPGAAEVAATLGALEASGPESTRVLALGDLSADAPVESPVRRRRGVLIGVAVLAVLIGAVLLGTLTGSPAKTPPSTSPSSGPTHIQQPVAHRPSASTTPSPSAKAAPTPPAKHGKHAKPDHHHR